MGEANCFTGQLEAGLAQLGHVADESVQGSSVRPSATKMRSGKFNQMHGLQVAQVFGFGG
jgi:hypothetical protein